MSTASCPFERYVLVIVAFIVFALRFRCEKWDRLYSDVKPHFRHDARLLLSEFIWMCPPPAAHSLSRKFSINWSDARFWCGRGRNKNICRFTFTGWCHGAAAEFIKSCTGGALVSKSWQAVACFCRVLKSVHIWTFSNVTYSKTKYTNNANYISIFPFVTRLGQQAAL